MFEKKYADFDVILVYYLNKVHKSQRDIFHYKENNQVLT